MHNQKQQQHLKTNNIISKFAVIVLSVVLLTGISLVSVLQITATGQSQHHQQQYLAFGQTPSEESVAGEQTFRSAFDTFVSSEPGGYGIYEERKSNVFKPGETFSLYVEPVGYAYGTVTDEDGNTLYTMNFTLDFFISDTNGNILGGQENLPVSNIVSYHQNKELNLDISIDQSSPFPPGDYVIIYRITDENSGKSFDIIKDVTVQDLKIGLLLTFI
jgi:hypothetical protein